MSGRTKWAAINPRRCPECNQTHSYTRMQAAPEPIERIEWLKLGLQFLALFLVFVAVMLATIVLPVTAR
jgi:hypothetical protein